ncbi:protein of unknown function [Pseudomonas sp. JV241A]|nr:protein of unknown function [Pseudomonas sp. JV241A]
MTAVVTVMSVQPTSEKLTVWHCSGSAAWASTGRLSTAASNSEGEPFIRWTPGFFSRMSHGTAVLYGLHSVGPDYRAIAGRLPCNRVDTDHLTAKIKRLQGASYPVQTGSHPVSMRSFTALSHPVNAVSAPLHRKKTAHKRG